MTSMADLADMVRACTDAMVDAGLRCSYYSGWSSRSAGSLTPAGVICHHTASEGNIDKMLFDGRSDLPGPLCTWALHDDGAVVVISCGRANHAGSSRSGFPSNGSSFGIEATGPKPTGSTGPSAFAWDEYQVMVGCICKAMGWTVKQTVVPGHKESCDPPGRKVDPFLDMNALRAGASAFMAGSPPPGFTGGDEDMPYADWPERDRKQLVEDVARIIGEGKTVDGSKPQHLVDRSQDELRKRLDLIRYGDQVGGDFDAHDYTSVEGVFTKAKQVEAKVDVIAAQVQALYDALGAAPGEGRGRS
jgi:hypothetical protein